MSDKRTEEIDRLEFHSKKYDVTVILHNARFQCTKCKLWKPASEFGMLSDPTAIRNQPQCKDCRR